MVQTKQQSTGEQMLQKQKLLDLEKIVHEATFYILKHS